MHSYTALEGSMFIGDYVVLGMDPYAIRHINLGNSPRKLHLFQVKISYEKLFSLGR